MLRKHTDLQLLMLLESTLDVMERCASRTREAIESGNPQSAAWNAALREQYTRMRDEILAEMGKRGLAPPLRDMPGLAQGASPE